MFVVLYGRFLSEHGSHLVFKCINDALRSDQPKTVILDIIAQLNEDSQKLESGFFTGKLYYNCDKGF